MPDDWVNRPRLNPAEEALFLEFVKFDRFCGGEARPQDAIAWFEMRDIGRSEWPWLAEVFGAMAKVAREQKHE